MSEYALNANQYEQLKLKLYDKCYDILGTAFEKIDSARNIAIEAGLSERDGLKIVKDVFSDYP